jgi:redox-sensitive bicupin YhaK (pirin superfamily)
MPIIVDPATYRSQAADGVSVTVLADEAIVGENVAMEATRVELAAGALSPVFDVGDDEMMIYVASGSGSATVAGQNFPLADESVLWLDPGDGAVTLTGGPTGLTVLVARSA